MQVICTDGTTFSCEGYELTEYGVRLFGHEHTPGDERYDEDPTPVGYVPHERLWYIVPDGVTPNVPGLSVPQGQPGVHSAGRQQPEREAAARAGAPPSGGRNPRR